MNRMWDKKELEDLISSKQLTYTKLYRHNIYARNTDETEEYNFTMIMSTDSEVTDFDYFDDLYEFGDFICFENDSDDRHIIGYCHTDGTLCRIEVTSINYINLTNYNGNWEDLVEEL